jgi:hypothetical protein
MAAKKSGAALALILPGRGSQTGVRRSTGAATGRLALARVKKLREPRGKTHMRMIATIVAITAIGLTAAACEKKQEKAADAVAASQDAAASASSAATSATQAADAAKTAATTGAPSDAAAAGEAAKDAGASAKDAGAAAKKAGDKAVDVAKH